MKIIYELPKTYVSACKQHWDISMHELGVEFLPDSLNAAFKMAFFDAMSDAIKSAIFDVRFMPYVNAAMVEGWVASAIDGMSEEECKALITSALEYIPEDENGKHIMSVMCREAFDTELDVEEEDPELILSHHYLAGNLVTKTFHAVLTEMVQQLDPNATLVSGISDEQLRATAKLFESGAADVEVSSDMSYVIVEVGTF